METARGEMITGSTPATTRASTEGKTQNVLGFTVRVCRPDGKTVVGTAFVVDRPHALLVTCQHVVRDASPDPVRQGARVWLYLPQLPEITDKTRIARVARCFTEYDDDVVVLQLDPPELPSELDVAILGTAEESVGFSEPHQFRSFGYRRLKQYQGLPALGQIIDFTDMPAGRILQSKPVMLTSQHIDSGMSGAAVLDVWRNLVVGVISETWDSGREFADRDTNFAVNGAVLRIPPLSLPLYEELPLAPSLRPSEAAQRTASQTPMRTLPFLPFFLNAPPPLGSDWIGRGDLLDSLTADWHDPGTRIVGLIGFGGEGKSSLARRWVDKSLEKDRAGITESDHTLKDDLDIASAHKSDPRTIVPDGVFWWGFYETRSVDAFLETAIVYLGGEQLAEVVRTTSSRVDVIGALLRAGRFLFVLDGFEVWQHQEGDRYGLLQSNDLKQLLELFAAPGHQSFCLITSRAPVLDLISNTAYKQQDVDRLSAADGRALLHKIGVTGSDMDLDKIVSDWNGHALTLSLLGAYLKERYNGDVAHSSEIPAPTANEPRYERVHRVLRRYDDHLTPAERAFLTFFSAFRTPVEESAFKQLFRRERKPPKRSLRREQEIPTEATKQTDALITQVAALDDSTFATLLLHLQDYRLLRYHPATHHYTTHPLVRDYYLDRLIGGDHTQAREAHNRIKEYYLALAGDRADFPTLESLMPLIEAIHHACRAEAYDEAWKIYDERVNLLERNALTYELCAYQTDLELMLEFFPDSDTSHKPQVGDQRTEYWILNAIGLDLMCLGRLNEALRFLEQTSIISSSLEDWTDASIGYCNLADLNVDLGFLDAGGNAAKRALDMARHGLERWQEYVALAWQVWIDHLRGDWEAASETYQQASEIEQPIDPNSRYLYSVASILYAELFRRVGDAPRARQLAVDGLKTAEDNHWVSQVSWCNRILGDLDADIEQHDSARQRYDEAFKTARNISKPAILIEVLLARGRWAARRGEIGEARRDLEEALVYANKSSYRIYEADIRIGLAWVHSATGNSLGVRIEGERAKKMSEEMGYYWGKVDAEEVLASIA